MATTNVTSWGHSCVGFERGGRTLVIDPGAFSDPTVLDQRVEAVLITHEHADHLDVARVSALLQSSSSIELWAPAEVNRPARPGRNRPSTHPRRLPG